MRNPSTCSAVTPKADVVVSGSMIDRAPHTASRASVWKERNRAIAKVNALLDIRWTRAVGAKPTGVKGPARRFFVSISITEEEIHVARDQRQRRPRPWVAGCRRSEHSGEGGKRICFSPGQEVVGEGATASIPQPKQLAPPDQGMAQQGAHRRPETGLQAPTRHAHHP